jgi:hypothetical protein
MKISFFAFLLLLSTGLYTMAQGAKLEGSVKDRFKDEFLTGATIKIVETGNTAFSDFDGNFAFSGLTPGIYTIAVNLISYDTSKFYKVNVSSSQTSKLNITLEKSDANLPKGPYMTAEMDDISPNAGLETL